MVPMIFSRSSPVLGFETTTITTTHTPWFHTACLREQAIVIYIHPLCLLPPPLLPRLRSTPCSSASFFALQSLTPESHTLLPLHSRDTLPVFSYHTSTCVSLSAAGNNGNGAALCRTETDALLCVCLGLSADRLIAIFRIPLSRFNTMGCCSGRCTLIFLCTFQLVSLFSEKKKKKCAFHTDNYECC